jgi:NitT/TauT family transport system ATP-binding protein
MSTTSLLESGGGTPRPGRVLLDVAGLGKTYGTGSTAVRALDDITFSVEEGEFVCIVGPSGAGKTTLLRCLAGLMSPSDGVAEIAGEPISGPPPGLAMVFQDYGRSLMPWLRIIENVGFPLRNKGVPKAERRARSMAALESVGIAGFAQKYPWQLSGGMQQRVAIARALAYRPQVLLMDEPFASVDAQTRADLEDLVLEVRQRYDVTIVFVTHDIDESVYLSDRIVILSAAPTTVREVLEVDLPRPRDQVATEELPEFARLRAHVWRSIKRPAKTLSG